MVDHDPGRDLVPVRETAALGYQHNYRQKSTPDDLDRAMEIAGPTSFEQRSVAKWTREELEDRYFRLNDESSVLKKHARKQEDKIKRMATKLLRLLSDRKKQEQDAGKNGKKRDIETEEVIEEMQERIRELERQTRLLQEKLIVARQQLATHLKRPVPAPYRQISSRVDTGIAKQSVKVFGSVSQSSGRTSRSPYTRYSQQPYSESRAETQLDDVGPLREQLDAYALEIANLKEQIQERDAKHEDEIVAARSQLSHEQRQTLQENVSLIRLQRELKQKTSQLQAIESQCSELDENLRLSQQNHEQILRELEELGKELANEQRTNASLQANIKSQAAANIIVAELKEKISDLEKENKILKESNDKLIDSALSTERISQPVPIRDDSRKPDFERILVELEKVSNEKSSLLESTRKTQDMLGQREKELNEMKVTYFQLKEQYETLQSKFKHFTQNSELSSSDFEEAVNLMHQRKESALHEQLAPGSTATESYDSIRMQLAKVNADHAETINELNKTREILLVQHKINRDYQLEVETVSGNMINVQRDYEQRYAEQARLLELRASRIRQLERQLQDVAHGTSDYKFEADDHRQSDGITAGELVPSVHLKPGENLLEIHISKFCFSEDGLKAVQDATPTSFLTWAFFHFEIQSTPPLTGARPEFDFTSQYVIVVDDLFLHYINRERVAVELQQAIGAEYVTLATGKIGMSEILDKPQGRLNGQIHMIGAREGESGIIFGVLEFWIRLRVPIEQSLRAFKERSKALGYFKTNNPAADKSLSSLPNQPNEFSRDGINELHIKIISCQGLRSRIPEGGHPSPYCIYKFHTKADHDTAILKPTNAPRFDDHNVYRLPMDLDLDLYLRTKPLEIFVFDDSDPELSAYLGLATVHLLPLAHNKHIVGEFELKTENGVSNGSIAIDIRWSYSYVPPAGSMATAHISPGVIAEHSLLSGEKQILSGEPPREPHSANIATVPTPKPRGIKVGEPPIDTRSPPTNTDKKPPIVPREKNKNIESLTMNSSKDLIVESKSFGSQPLTNLSEFISSDESSESDSCDVVVTTPKKNDVKQGNTSLQQQKGSNISPIASPGPKTLKFGQLSSKLSLSEESDCRTESDTDIVMATAKSPATKLRNQLQAKETVVVVVSYLTLLENSSVMNDATVQMLFVEYRFLDFPQEELETPFALPKPKANQKIIYNFRKVFHLELSNNAVRKQLLMNIIKASSPNKSRIKFTIVSEPPDDSKEIDCEDIGYAFVDLKKILANQQDIVEENIQVFDARDTSVVIGHLNVTVEAFATLLAINREL